jgi:3-dehydroquinate synthase
MTDTADLAAKLTVPLGRRAYEIVIGFGLLDQLGSAIAARLQARRAVIVSDENVAALYGARAAAALSDVGITTSAITIAPGEASKSFATLERVCGDILRAGLERGDLVVALGGGVVGDLAGFAAAIVRRGMRFVQVPTSLLAQVDSSVGGKTGINMPEGKNLIGAFHQPSLVLADIGTLDTLPERQLKAGYAEVVKYGLIADPNFFAWLEANGTRLLAGDAQARVHAVDTSCRAKAGIVAEDEREAGRRALLNLGHTFGHALEAATGYGERLIHGEAVAIGMVLAFDLSAELALCPPADAKRMRAHLAECGLSTNLSDVPGALPDANGMIALMAQDKKVKDGKPTFVLAHGIGKAFITQDVPPERLQSFLANALANR